MGNREPCLKWGKKAGPVRPQGAKLARFLDVVRPQGVRLARFLGVARPHGARFTRAAGGRVARSRAMAGMGRFCHALGPARACVIVLLLAVTLLSGCVDRIQKTEKLRDIPFEVLAKEDVPQEFSNIIEQKKDLPFRLTYTDAGFLYIAEGYGAQLKTGYSVSVTELYETEEAVYLHTNLLGPPKGERTEEITTFPYVVIKLEAIDKTVVFD